MSTAESAPLAIAHSKDCLSEQMSTLSSELADSHGHGLFLLDERRSEGCTPSFFRMDDDWEAGSPVVATIAAPPFRVTSVAELSV